MRSFPKPGLWNVHGPYHIEAIYANGITLIIDHKLPNGIRFEGSDGWIFVTRGAVNVTACDPVPRRPPNPSPPASRKSLPLRSAKRTRPSPPKPEQRPPPRLAYQHPDPPARRDLPRAGAPLHQRLHPRLDFHEAGPQADLGPGEGGLSNATTPPTPCVPVRNAPRYGSDHLKKA